MSKKRKSKQDNLRGMGPLDNLIGMQYREAKQAHKPIHSLVPDASHTGDYQDKLSQPEHTQLSTPNQQMDHPARQLPSPQGGSYWGDQDPSMMMAAQAAQSQE